MSHKKKAHQKQKTAGSPAANYPGNALSGSLIHQSGIIARGVSSKYSTHPISYTHYAKLNPMA